MNPLLQRALMGAALGGLVGSGVTKNLGVEFLGQFLKPLAQSPKALSAVARVMYERETQKAWSTLPTFDQDTWIARARNAVEAMTAMVTQAMAGGR